MTQEMTAKAKTEMQTFKYSDLVEKWIGYAQVSASSVKSYTKGIRRLMEYCRAKEIRAISRDSLISYREYLRGKYAVATANLYLTAAKLFLSFLAVEGYLQSNPADRVKGLKVVAGHKKEALSAEMVQSVLNSFETSMVKGKRDKAMFALMATAGLRTIEISRADVSDIVLRDGKYFLLVQGKGHNEKDAAVRISEGVYRLIQEYLKASGNQQVLFSSVSRRNCGGRLSANSISRIIKKALREAGYNSKTDTRRQQ